MTGQVPLSELSPNGRAILRALNRAIALIDRSDAWRSTSKATEMGLVLNDVDRARRRLEDYIAKWEARS